MPFMPPDMVLLHQEKKNKLSTPFEGIPYTVFQKKGSMGTAERTTDGRMVTRNTKDFKSCPSSTKERPQATLSDKADDAIVASIHVQYCQLDSIGKNRSSIRAICSIWRIGNFLDDPSSRVFYLPFASH